jgi:hypothetical protein
MFVEIRGNDSNEIILEKVFDAGANTIWSEMRKLRGKAPEQKDSMRRRWVWELIQNASDCIPKGGKININILLKDEKIIEFTHDGIPFTYENLLDLITQISSKQSDPEEKTGKFGTGFISTHLLSEKVKVNGVFKQDENIYKNLNFVIDRSGDSYQDIRNKIKESLKLIEELKQNETEIIEKPNEIRTTFYYDSCSSQETKQAVKVGLEDLISTLPFVLALNKSIQSITVNGAKYQINKCSEDIFGGYQIIEIINPFGEPFNVLIKRENEVSIALLVQKIDNSKYRVLPFPHNTPKLFCRFPLVGTESFRFPIVINCSKFDVEKDRNAIHEGCQENIKFLKLTLKLYDALINYACENKWENIYNLCFTGGSNNSVLQNKLYEIVKTKYEKLPIVDVNLNGKYYGRAALKVVENSKLENQISIPNREDKDLSDEFWDIVNSFSKFYIPTKDSYIQWNKMCKNEINLSNINDKYMKDKDLSYFKENFNGETVDIYSWLNEFYHFWIDIKKQESFIREAYVLNQNYKFVKISEVSIDENIDNDLKNILLELGDDIKDNLLAIEINKLPVEVITKKKDNKYISKQIQDKVNRILSDETINNAIRNPENQSVFNKLTDWFLKKPKLSEELFETLYGKRGLLSTPEESIRRFKIAEKIECNNIKYEQLDNIIDNHNKIADLIENLGNLSDQEIKQRLKHISAHSTFALEKFNLMKERSIENVYHYLRDIEDYKISSSLEEWKEIKYSDTVFPVIKDGRDINIIIRPSDQNKIIFFNDEELEALDDTDYELWTDNGQGNTRIITLGDIIKTTGISAIPLRNIYNK